MDWTQISLRLNMDSEIHLFSQFGHLSDTTMQPQIPEIPLNFGGRKKRLPLQGGWGSFSKANKSNNSRCEVFGYSGYMNHMIIILYSILGQGPRFNKNKQMLAILAPFGSLTQMNSMYNSLQALPISVSEGSVAATEASCGGWSFSSKNFNSAFLMSTYQPRAGRPKGGGVVPQPSEISLTIPMNIRWLAVHIGLIKEVTSPIAPPTNGKHLPVCIHCLYINWINTWRTYKT